MSSPQKTEVVHDIKPVKEAEVDLGQTGSASLALNLREAKSAKLNSLKDELSRFLEEELKKNEDTKASLADLGGTFLEPESKSGSARRSSFARLETVAAADRMPENSPDPDQTREHHSPASRELDRWLKETVSFGSAENPEIIRPPPPPPVLTEKQATVPRPIFLERKPSLPDLLVTGALPYASWFSERVLLVYKKIKPVASSFFCFLSDRPRLIGVIFVAVVVFSALLVRFNKEWWQRLFLEDGYRGAANLIEAEDNLSNFDFASATDNFNLAYDNFSRAFSRFGWLGDSLSAFLEDVPGLSQLKSARNLLVAGQNISKAGQDLSSALDELYRTNWTAYLGFGLEPQKPLTQLASSFRASLLMARSRTQAAQELLAEVKTDDLPDQKREEFLKLKEQLPSLLQSMDKAVEYADFLSVFLGQSGPKKYLVLFQNNTELRATGGFTGSYALATLHRGFLKELTVDDIYNIDRRARQKIIPPEELQHITPAWGMRDANWFVNFPDSARKVMEMYTENNGGPTVDGVLTVTPTVITKILEITGPVELPAYQKTLDSRNFTAEIQEEVEYGENREQPKQILMEFSPKFLEQLAQLDRDRWFKVVQVLLEGVEQKHILAYFRESALQKVAVENDFAGEIKKTDYDYLMIVHSNIKGSKSDAVTENHYDLQTSVTNDGFVRHSLTITRAHRGGQSEYGFYNRPNYDYLRVLVPKGSEFIKISGNYKPNATPLVSYYLGDFVEDENLSRYDYQATIIGSAGVKRFEEAGKTVFGFWLNLPPGQTKSVTIEYKTPIKIDGNEYLLLAQKQPGTLADSFSFSLTAPPDKQVIFRYPDLNLDGQNAAFIGNLEKNLIFGIQFQ